MPPKRKGKGGRRGRGGGGSDEKQMMDTICDDMKYMTIEEEEPVFEEEKKKGGGGGGGGGGKATMLAPARPLARNNNVCTVRMTRRGYPGFKFKPTLIVHILRGMYARKGFACVTRRDKGSKVCCHVYETGLIVACGGKTEMRAQQAITAIIWKLHKATGWDLLSDEYCVTNYVVSCAIGVCLDLPRMALAMGDSCSYDPEDFPGLDYYPNHPDSYRPCVIAYGSSNLIVVGVLGDNPLHECARIISRMPLFLLSGDRVMPKRRSASTPTPDADLSAAVYWPKHRLLPPKPTPATSSSLSLAAPFPSP